MDASDAGEGDVKLAVVPGAWMHVDLVEGLALAFVESDGVGQFYWELGEAADTDEVLFFFIEFVVGPYILRDGADFAVYFDIDQVFFQVDTCKDSDGTVLVATFYVVDKGHDLATYFKVQFQRSWKVLFREVASYHSCKGYYRIID